MDNINESILEEIRTEQGRVNFTVLTAGIFSMWSLSSEESFDLLGLPNQNESFFSYEKYNYSLPDSIDVLSRAYHISLISDYVDMLCNIYGNHEFISQWVKNKFESFHDKTPFEVINSEGLDGVLKVKRFLEKEICRNYWEAHVTSENYGTQN